MTMTDITLQSNHYKIAALGNHQEDKPLVVMLHGWLDNAASFAPLIPYLEDFNVIAIDLPGHGKSSHRSNDAHYHLVDYVNDLHALVTSQAWQPFYLVGHSLGGIISTIYSAAFPEMVKKLICIESAGPLTEPESSSVEQIRGSILSRLQADSKEIKQAHDLDSVIQSRLKVSDLTYENAKLIMMRNTHKQKSSELMWSSDKRLRTKSSLRLSEAQAQNIIENVLCPTHFVLGTTGFTKVKKLIRERRKHFKNVAVSTLNGGHHVHMEASEELATIIKRHFCD